jgi:transglutaminase-like putative cysteine protease
MRHCLWKLCCLAFLSAAPVSGQAAYLPPITLLSDNITYTVQADGTYTYEEAVTQRLNTQNAVDSAGDANIFYSGAGPDFTLLNAYTITSAGTRREVRPEQVLDQPAGDAAAGFYTDNRRKVIIFPGLSVGAVEHYHYIMRNNGTYFSNAFFAEQNFPVYLATQSASITVLAPAGLALHFQLAGMQGGQLADAPHGEKKWVYTLANAAAQAPEDGSINVADFSPHLDVTSFQNFAAIGAAYEANAAPKAAVTPAVQRLADAIAGKIPTPLGQAEALYNWVSRNIRYVGIDIGYGGYIPNPADQIIATGYGDCKDHVTLLKALLAAKHIPSSGVLVSLSDDFNAPSIALPHFDHIITYIPQFNVFLDSTAQFAPFGRLPRLELGKQALITGAPGIPARVITLPVTGPVPDAARAFTQEVLSPDGTISGSTQIDNSGRYELHDRETFASFDPASAAQYATRLMENDNEQGSGDFASPADPRDLTHGFTYRSQFSLPAYAALPGHGTFPIPIGVPLNLAAFTQLVALPARTAPTLCLAQNISDETRLRLPAGFRLQSLPADVDFADAIGSYTATYTIRGDTVQVERQLLTHAAGPTCGPAQYQQLRELGFAIGRDFRGVVSY